MPKRPRIRVLLRGGLGNQLFQYAFGRALALRSSADLELDAVSLFAQDTVYNRRYELDAFSLPDEVRVIRKRPIFFEAQRKILRLRSLGKSLDKSWLVVEADASSQVADFANWRVTRDVTLIGYWQSEQYFQDSQDVLRCDLCFREPIHPLRKHLAATIQNSESVAVHCRRVQFDKPLGMDYYAESICQLRRKLHHPRFYIFTDTPDWWRANGEKAEDIKLVEPAGIPAIEDFKLMTLCHHFIIANSSFSWWAGWLGEQDASILKAPGSSFWDSTSTVPDQCLYKS